ncbi:hypothetical protein [Nocardia arthritidis]|uniref:Uncharacterized protein n=1 Tax=Nocardia arthritidis TaxID=228602 RepID=A0A6G9YCT4_9NOCA|nr:hypothetical protein [Nocardia arthritidis]QIS10974.1 hypothetical protein F5544_15455 [Nocardia arthritidis]
MPEELAASEEPSAPRTNPLRRIVIGVGAAALVVLIVLLGVLIPPKNGGVSTDRLGPDRGERIADYLVRAKDSLNGTDADEHWALVSFTDYVTPQQIPAHSGGLRISEVIQHVPIPGVQTPVLGIPVPAGDAVAVAAADAAASLLTVRPPSGNERIDRTVAVTAARLRAGCACTPGLVVRGQLPRLRELAAQNGIRAVQALPADAVWDRFAIVPLLPEWTETATPGPDNGPVPDK